MSSIDIKTIKCDDHTELEFFRSCSVDEKFTFFMNLHEFGGKEVCVKLSESLMGKIVQGFNDVALFEHAPADFEIYEVSTR